MSIQVVNSSTWPRLDSTQELESSKMGYWFVQWKITNVHPFYDERLKNIWGWNPQVHSDWKKTRSYEKRVYCDVTIFLGKLAQIVTPTFPVDFPFVKRSMPFRTTIFYRFHEEDKVLIVEIQVLLSQTLTLIQTKIMMMIMIIMIIIIIIIIIITIIILIIINYNLQFI